MVNLDPNILVVEDETEIRELIALHLLRQGFKVTECYNVSDAIDELGKKKFDVILLDWMLPGLSGMDLLGFLKDKEIDTRVVMVTAKTDPADIVQGLESSADDYLTKPFDPTILMARVSAVMRRVPKKENTEAQDEMNIGPLYINFRTYDVMLNNEKLHLTPSEFILFPEVGLKRWSIRLAARWRIPIRHPHGKGIEEYRWAFGSIRTSHP